MRTVGANDEVRVALVGIGDAKAVGGVGGRGRQLTTSLQNASVRGSLPYVTSTRIS